MRYSRLAATVAAAALTLAACGSDGDPTGTAAATESSASATETMSESASSDTMTESMTDTMTDTMTESMTESMTDTMSDTGATGAAGTIVDVAAGNPDFSTLVAAVQAAGLDGALSGAGPFTVFAPTNEAFDKALADLGMSADELLANKELLTQVLTYHVVAGEVPAATVATMNGQEVPTLNGASVTITVEGDKVMVNDATVTAPDVEASNGVIHVIDKVLLPPSDGSTDGTAGDSTMGASGTDAPGTITEVAASNPDFSILVQAVDAAGLTSTLAGEGPFTVFAPTNEAFEQALSDLDMTADELLADKELLTQVLTYHVIAGEYPAADVVGLDGTEVTTVEGSPVTITIDGDKVMVNDATVVGADVMASNGVIHVIDKVLLPPSN